MVFYKEQQEQIDLGFENGLTSAQVSVYADERFNSWQMEAIRLGFQYGLTSAQIAVYSDERFDWSQMTEIRLLIQKEPTGESARIITEILTKEVF